MKKVDRREALAKLAGLGAGVAGLGLCTGCPGGSTYGRELAGAIAGADGRLVFKTSEVQRGQAMQIMVNGRAGFLFHAIKTRAMEDDKWYAVDARCTHSGCKIRYSAPTQNFVCPCHGSTFSPQGEALKGPAREPLMTYRVIVREDEVEVVPNESEQQPEEQAG